MHTMPRQPCVIIGDQLADYHFGQSHPFGPLRYPAFKEEFDRRKLSEMTRQCSPASATDEQIALFHQQDYIDTVKQFSAHGSGYLDSGDTPARAGIYEAACFVVGSVIKGIDNIINNECAGCFVPIAGLHHARRDSAAGFCVFNDCGIAIEYLRRVHHIRRIAYVDIDAHHGDGVFYAFEDDPDLCIVDFHQDGHTLYPGTGFITETGKGDAAGTKLNIPLAPWSSDKSAMQLWQYAASFIDRAQPEFIILQCGADSLENDPITELRLTSRFHAHVATELVKLSRTHCPGRLLMLGGGGYQLDNIRAAWNDVIESLIDQQA